MSARRTRKDDGSQWTVADSRSVYGIRHWGAGYFAINDQGRVEVRPNGPQSTPIDLYEQIDELRSSGLSLPLLVRFPDILQDRVRQLLGLGDTGPEFTEVARSIPVLGDTRAHLKRRIDALAGVDAASPAAVREKMYAPV